MLLRPGVTCGTAIKFLEELTTGSLNNLSNRLPRFEELDQLPHGIVPIVLEYERWVQQTAREVSAVFADHTIVARLRGGRYGTIQATSNPAQVLFLLRAELSELRDYLGYEFANELRELQQRFIHHKGRTLVLDSNDVLHYQRFDTIPWVKLYGAGCVVVFPHVIVDEIDKKGYDTGSDKVRTRARGVYRLLEQLQITMDATGGRATLKDGTAVEIIADEIEHVRLGNNDNEAIACASMLQQALAPGQVTVITRDIGMRARARTRKLKAEALPDKYLIPGGGFSGVELDKALAEITPPPEGSAAPQS